MSTVYPPPAEFAAQAHVKGLDEYRDLYRRAEENPESSGRNRRATKSTGLKNGPRFSTGSRLSRTGSSARKPTSPTTAWTAIWPRHRKNKVAILWEGEPGDQRFITYQELHRLVVRFASVLKSRGYKAGDRAIIYMPMVPELPIAMLACARLGIIHSVVFGGFSAEALKARIQDLGATMVITADGGFRRGKEVKLKPAVDEALADCPRVRDVIVYRRTGSETPMQSGPRSLVA